MARDRALELTKKYFGEWKRGNYVPEIPAEAPQNEPRSASVDWPSPTLPLIAIGYHGPAYSDAVKDKAPNRTKPRRPRRLRNGTL